MTSIIDTYVKLESVGDEVGYIGYVLENDDENIKILTYRTDIFTPFPQIITFKHSSIWGSGVLHLPKKGLKFTYSELSPSKFFDQLVKKTAHQAIVEDL